MTRHFRIKLSDDGPGFECDEGDTLLRAGLRAGFGLAYECNTGACGSCKFDLLSGEIEDLFPEASGLRPKERERGKLLACQCVPHGDCTIKIRTGDEYASTVRPVRFKARFMGKTALTPDMALFSFIAQAGARFLPGQYAMLSVPALGQARAYSMSNIANDDGLWQFVIRRVPEGKVTSYLFDCMRENDELEIDAPFGIAYLRTDNARPIVGIAGGSGLAPVLSILCGAARHASIPAFPTMFYGGRTPTDIPDVPRLAREAGIDLDFHPVISMPEAAAGIPWSGKTGFVHEFIVQRLANPLADYEYYLAGPPPMIEAAVRLLVADYKVPTSQIHFDRFF